MRRWLRKKPRGRGREEEKLRKMFIETLEILNRLQAQAERSQSPEVRRSRLHLIPGGKK
jgi:hypothetical protein